MGKEQTVEGKRGRRKLKRIGKKVGNAGDFRCAGSNYLR